MKRVLLLLFMITFLAACINAKNTGNVNSCVISVITDEEAVIDEETVYFEDGGTVFDVLSDAVKRHKLQFDYSGIGEMVYINGIDNLYHFDKGAESGWVFTVNGEYMTIGCGKVKVEEGDRIEWKYVTETVEELNGEA